MSTAVVEDAQGWTLTPGERRIDQIQLDFRVGLMLDDGTLIVIESPFVIGVGAAAATVVPETLENVAAVLEILHQTVTSVRALRTGALQVGLEDGKSIEVPPGRGYENWQMMLRDGTQLVGLPDGDIAAFPPRG